ncbi:beta-lactamase family protein [Enterococcus sp. BWT-B8]|uniref:serine hydrolase domain-containing protein n=1 Tax=Enterococcus sp. BWT-B8 TaxID=2885157 RepID=UPI001E3DFE14|nr:serine hydrolase [Enterococcus sp. BWT-B8]MCB5950511.1 beta-lactamase family protein [Enterococcus sp. BWT-B8]
MNQKKITELEQVIRQGYQNTAGIIVLKNGQILYETYFNDCTEENPIHVFSVTKSILSILIGIALDRGEIECVDQNILAFLPNYVVKKDKTSIQRVKIRELLTMTAPFNYQEEPYIDYFMSSNYSEFALDLLGKSESGGTFRYTPLVGPDILSGILVNAAGKSVLDYAKEYLFSPLGITVEKNLIFQNQEEQMAFYASRTISGWVSDAAGINTAGWGLTLTLQDLAKIGQLYLNEGKWGNKQIVSSRWVEESTQKHSYWKEAGLSYGYLWWVLSDSVFAAMGDGGDILYVDTKEKTVIALTGLFEQKTGDRIELIEKYVKPMIE